MDRGAVAVPMPRSNRSEATILEIFPPGIAFERPYSSLARLLDRILPLQHMWLLLTGIVVSSGCKLNVVNLYSRP